MRPPDFFCSPPPLPFPSSILFPARLLLSPPHTGTPLRFSLFPARSRPRPRNLPLRPSPAEKSPQRTAAPRTAGTKKPFCGRFGPPTRSPLEWNSI